MHANGEDKAALDAITGRLYAAFCNKDGRSPDLDALRPLFHPRCLVCNTVDPAIQAQDLDAFIAMRKPLLADGTLVDFEEWEVDERTLWCGRIASRWSLYAKTGRRDGIRFATRGIKTLQFVRTDAGWRISALAWDDERPGLALGDTLADASAAMPGPGPA